MSIGELSVSVNAIVAASPLPALTATVGVYIVACRLHTLARKNPLANPVAISVLLMIAILYLTGTSYSAYFAGAKLIHFLLGPSVIALAIPLHHQMPRLRRALVPLLGGLIAGSATAVASAIAICVWLHCPFVTVASVAPKSVTTAVAMLISAKIGGLPSLTAAIVILTGITGATLSNVVLDTVGVRRDDVRGFAMGVASHGIGTARAFQISEEAGAYSGLGMAMNGTMSAFVLPVLLPILSGWLI
ncbi:LrgB family protein [Paraburkholderia youngii]|uniref:Putative murein hydrolase (TIGR00659 family) n=1 Tax=Paraburkholderia youngii TaxID=2782701 RepID=A0A7W8L7W2_9BURK|nr:LrgB family protein [Paraburkholderia youngii]MBB5401725.1 putative murein hydrolase (TIGR00659 family) [Paraburkholderia youngii]